MRISSRFFTSITILLISMAMVQSKLYYYIDSIINCKDTPHLKNKLNWTNLISPGKGINTLMNFEWIQEEYVESISKIEVIVSRCRNGWTQRSPCDYYNTFKLGNASCALIASKNMLWSPAVEATTPPVRCPVKPAVYKIVNASVDMGILTSLQFPTGYNWRLKVKFYKLDELEGCAVLDGALRNTGRFFS